MFRCHSLIWVSLVWSCIFAHTIMSLVGTNHIAKTAALLSAMFLTVTGAALLIRQHVAKHTKIILWFCSWFVAVMLGMVFFSEEYIADVTLNIWVTAVTFLASLFWCVVSHADKITEPGLHWYIWSLISIVVVSSAFNNTSPTAIAVYIFNCTVLATVNVGYLVHICRRQANNHRRCRQLLRVSVCFFISFALLVGSVLHKTNTLTTKMWTEYIMGIQVALLLGFIVDGLIGFSQNDYKECPDMPNDDV